MDNSIPNNNSSNGQSLAVPAFKGLPALSLDLSNIREAEKRYIEAKNVNPVTYSDLEHCFNESYRDIKRHLTTIQAQLRLADKKLEEIKAEILLDKYPDFMKDKPKSQDNSDLRKAFLHRDSGYSEMLDKINQLKALESLFEGKFKVTENVCRYMRTQMQLIIRSGLTNQNLYIRK